MESSKIRERLHRHRDHVGGSPRRRDSYLARRKRQTLGKHVADDRRDAAVAINHRCTRGTVIDDKTVVPFIHFQKRGAREPPAVSEVSKPAAHEMWETFGIDECQDLLFRHERFLPDFEGAPGKNGTLEFDDGLIQR